LPTGKNFARNAFEQLSHVLMASCSAQNHCFAFLSNENGNKRRRIASFVIPRIVKVLHTSRKCWRCALASSFGLPENGLACTMLINTGLSSKFLSPTVVVGPVGTLVLEGAENSQRPLVLTKCCLRDQWCLSFESRETSEE
jgi:hypothetical protein